MTDAPWEKYARPVTPNVAPAADDGPWNNYAKPASTDVSSLQRVYVNAPSGTNAPSEGVGYGEDIAKSTAGGLGRGVAGTVGLAGTIGGLVHSGLSAAGVPEGGIDYAKRVLNRAAPMTRAFSGPDAGQVQSAIEGVTGKFYEPQTVPGQYFSTAAEFVPGSLMGGGGIGARVANTVIPAVTSETAGQYFKGTAAEPWARGIAGLGGGFVGAKAITPFAAPTPKRLDNVNTLQKEGVALTAGDITGSKPLRLFESAAADIPFLSGPARKLAERQAASYNRAVSDTMFDPRELAKRGIQEGRGLPEQPAFAAGKQSLKDKYTELTTPNYLKSDPKLIKDIHDVEARYTSSPLKSQQTKDVAKIRDDLVDSLVTGQGQMPGKVYQATRSRFGKLAKATDDVELSDALRGYQTALDQAMERSLSPRDAAAWRLNNARYHNMKQLEGAVAGAHGENLSPARVAQAVQAGRTGQYAAGTTQLDRLASAAASTMRALPNSQTAARSSVEKMFNVPNALATGGGLAGAGGLATGLINPLTLGLAAVPIAAGRFALSKPGQAYLANRALPQNVRDILAQTLAQQATAQPSGVARNQAEQDAYEKKRKERR